MLVIIALVCWGLLWGLEQYFQSRWEQELFVAIQLSATEIFCGETFSLTEKVENRKSLPLPFLQLTIPFKANGIALVDRQTQHSVPVNDFHQIFALAGGSFLQRRFPLKAEKRGAYPLRTLVVHSRNLFFTPRYQKVYPMQKDILVYPALVPPEKFFERYQMGLGDLLAKISLTQDPLRFFSLRTYQPGDPYRAINWKKTAQQQNLVVNQYQPVAQGSLRIILELPQPYHFQLAKIVEEELSLVATLAQQATALGWQVTVTSNACDEAGANLFTTGQVFNSLAIFRQLAYVVAEKSGPRQGLFSPLTGDAVSWVVVSYANQEKAQHQAALQQVSQGAALWFTVVERATLQEKSSAMEQYWEVRPV